MRMLMTFFVARVLFFSFGAVAEPGYDVIVIAGQSNAVGYGCGPFEDVSQNQDGRIYQVLPSGFIARAEEPLLHAPSPGPGGKGFGMTFARVYAMEWLASDRQVLLVPSGLGATSILQWDDIDEGIDFDPPDGKNRLPIRFDSTELFDTMISQTRLALAAGAPVMRNRVVAFLWHQGETDLMYMHSPSFPLYKKMPNVVAYRKRLEALMASVRAALPGKTSFPVVFGEVGSYLPFSGDPSIAAFNGGFSQSARTIDRAAVASADGLVPGSAIGCSYNNDPRFPDGDPYHITAAGQVEFGKRYFKAFRSISASK